MKYAKQINIHKSILAVWANSITGQKLTVCGLTQEAQIITTECRLVDW